MGGTVPQRRSRPDLIPVAGDCRPAKEFDGLVVRSSCGFRALSEPLRSAASGSRAFQQTGRVLVREPATRTHRCCRTTISSPRSADPEPSRSGRPAVVLHNGDKSSRVRVTSPYRCEAMSPDWRPQRRTPSTSAAGSHLDLRRAAVRQWRARPPCARKVLARSRTREQANDEFR